MNNDERAAVQNEQNFFAGAISFQKPSTNCITAVRLRFDSDGDLFFDFATVGSGLYTVCVVLKDKNNLEWKECQALSAVMQMSQRGTEMNPVIFGNCLKTIASNLGRVDGPTTLQGFSIATVIPGTSSMRVTDPDTIISTGLEFDNDGDILMISRTKRGSVYVICIRLHLNNMALTVLEGDAFSGSLQLLETGDVLSPDKFLAMAVALKKMFNNLTVSTKNGQYIISMLPTPVQNNTPLPSIVFEAAQRVLPSLQTGPGPAASSTTSVGPYKDIRVMRPLKQSGQAQVYEGMKGSTKIALKVYQDLANQPDDSFKTEVKMLLKMSYHNNVVTVLDFFEKPKPAIAMEFVDGQDLWDYLESSCRLSEPDALKLTIGIAEGLYHLHRNNIIHLDMKTPNILRRTDGTPVIIDLGLSAVVEKGDNPRSGGSRGGQIRGSMTIRGSASTIRETYRMQKTRGGKGSLLWMAPEMIAESEWSDRTDVYAFGIIMWEVFSGKQPFIYDLPDSTTVDSLKVKIATGFRPHLKHVSHIDKKLTRIISMCWHRDPKQRPTMMRVLDMLRRTDPKALFESFDHDDSGTLEYSEFVKFLEKYAAHVRDPHKISALFKAIDLDSSGSICFEEFEAFWSSVQTHGLAAYISNQGARKVQAVREKRPRRSDDCRIQ